jgi:flagellin-like protein
MHGVSEVIAIILILMITISLAGLAYMFMSTTISDVTSSAGSTVDTTTSSMITSFTIENMDIDKVYVRNTGQSVLTDLSVYVNDEPANYNITPSSIASGAVGTITIYSFIPDGAVVKLTSPSGFSTSKVVNECSKSVACWKLDEGTGAVAYDSSPYGNSGMLINGPIWSVGKHGSGLLFDGTNDYVDLSFTYSSNTISLIVWLKINKVGASFQNYVASSSFGIWGWPPGGSDTVQIALTSTNTTGILRIATPQFLRTHGYT